MVQLQIGQKLFIRREYFRDTDDTLNETTVLKIGRVWVTLDHGYRMSIDGSMRLEDGGKAYLSREAFESERALKRAWLRFFNQTRDAGHPPKGLTMEKLTQAAELLGFSL